MDELTTGGVRVFSRSAGLDVGLVDQDLNEVRGRPVVAVICADCGHAPIGKVLAARGAHWLNYFAAPRTGDYPERRGPDGVRLSAPRVVMTHRLGVGNTLPAVWCEKHGRRALSSDKLAAAIEREAERKKVVRVAV